ncbi:MAG: hypothetical protein OK474_00060 [Thaumarchaeota archaeon]|nr:hypothetical protein [Nitrososphaerota archaeon]
MESDVLQQQRIEAELIAARLFRFRARRGLGVLYSLASVVPLLALILYATVPIPFAIAGTLAGTIGVWLVARSCGFGGFSRMQYSLDFLKGDGGTTYDERMERRLSWRRNFVWFLVTVGPGLGYTIANGEGYPIFAGMFLVILALALGFSYPAKEDRIVEKRVEDWAFIAGFILIAFVAILPGAPVWTWALASPLFVFCGTKSLYEAPKEFALVAS